MEVRNERTDDTSTPNPESSNPPNSSEPQPHPQAAGSVKKVDPAWEYVSVKKEGKVNLFTCLLCASSYRGGGINRLKQHLAGVSGQVSSCKKVSHDIRARMKQSLEEGSKKKPVSHDNVNEAREVEVREIEDPVASKRKAPDVGKVSSYFAPRTGPGAQPSIKSAWASQEAQHNARIAFAYWPYVNCIPFNALTCPLFQKLLMVLLRLVLGLRSLVFMITELAC